LAAAMLGDKDSNLIKDLTSLVFVCEVNEYFNAIGSLGSRRVSGPKDISGLATVVSLYPTDIRELKTYSFVFKSL
jgi:hypothetical protein